MKEFFFVTSILFVSQVMLAQNIDIQGHRGARGKLPENTIPAFIYALDQGVTTLEMDLAITKDKQVVVSHEPWMNHDICITPEGERIPAKSRAEYNIYQLTYDEVEKFDCGSVSYDRFPEQAKIKTIKPLLTDVIKAAERHMKGVTHFEANYNIEIKSLPEGDNVFHPEVEEFSDLVYNLIDQYLPWERVIIQSFDPRVLQYFNEKYPEVTLAYLTEGLESIDVQIKTLGFTPEIYSPYFKLLSKSKIQRLNKLKMKVIPWTINDAKTMKKLISWGVDGIITDYPDRAAAAGLTLDMSEKD